MRFFAIFFVLCAGMFLVPNYSDARSHSDVGFLESVGCFFKSIVFQSSCVYENTPALPQKPTPISENDAPTPSYASWEPNSNATVERVRGVSTTLIRYDISQNPQFQELLNAYEDLRVLVLRSQNKPETIVRYEQLPLPSNLFGNVQVNGLTALGSVIFSRFDCSQFGGDGKLTTDENGKIICANDRRGSSGSGGDTNTDEQTLTFDDGSFSLSVSGGNTVDLSALANGSTSTLEDLLDVASMAQSSGDLLFWNGTAWSNKATSTLNINTDDLVEGSNQFYTNALVSAYISGSSSITRLGQSISESELNINAPTNGYVLVASSTAVGGWAWAATSSLNILTNPFGPSINANELAAEDFGSFSCNGTQCFLDSGSVSSSTLLASTFSAGYLLQASSTAPGGFAWVSTSTLGILGGVSTTTGDWTGTFDGQEGSYYLDLANATGTTDDLTQGSTNLFSQWGTSGSNIYYDAGEVVIGTTTPEATLHVESQFWADLYIKSFIGDDYAATLRLAGENENNWQGGYMQYDGAQNKFIIGVHDADDKSTSSDTEVLTIDRVTGHLGIGTTTPSTTLHLSGTTGVPLVLQRTGTNNNVSINFANGSVSDWHAGLGSDGFFHIDDDANLGDNARFTIDTNGFVGIGSSTPSQLFTLEGSAYIAGHLTLPGTAANVILNSNYISGDGDDEGLFVDASGRVGIGTSTPTQLLSLSGSLAQAYFYDSDNNRGARIGVTDGFNAVFDSVGGATIIQANGAPYLTVGSGDAYFSNSDVGIGTTSPAYKLDVWGTGHFTEALTLDTALGVSSGGTGAASLTGILVGNGTLAFTATTSIAASYIDDVFVRNSGDTISGDLSFSGSAANIALGSNFLSGDGQDEGISVSGTGVVTTSGNLTIGGDATENGSAVISAADIDTCAELAALTGTTGSCGSFVLSASPFITGTLDASAGDFSSTLTMSGTAANIALGSNYLSGDGTDEGVFVDTNGQVVIGDGTAEARLQVAQGSAGAFKVGTGDITATEPQAYIVTGGGTVSFAVFDDNVLGTPRFIVERDGDTGIKTAAPGNDFDVEGGIRQADATSCDLTADADGDIVCVSDERLKKDIEPLPDTVLGAILAIEPAKYIYIEDESERVWAGFIAQDVLDDIPEAVSMQASGYYGLNSTAILSYLVKAFQEFYAEFTELAQTVTGFSERISTDELCVGDTCITEAQLIEVLEAEESNAPTYNFSPSNNGGGNGGGGDIDPTDNEVTDNTTATTTEDQASSTAPLIGEDKEDEDTASTTPAGADTDEGEEEDDDQEDEEFDTQGGAVDAASSTMQSQ